MRGRPAILAGDTARAGIDSRGYLRRRRYLPGAADHCGVMPAARMIGHHFSISDF